MAATLFSVSEHRSLSRTRIACVGGNPFARKFAGFGSPKALVCICSNSKDQKINGREDKIGKIKFDFINKGLKSRLRIPLFGLYADEKFAEKSSLSESVDQSPVLHNTANDGEISVRRRPKFVEVNFTHEMAKLLRKNLRSTSNFHDLMYHSAIASRLASADSSSKD